jgi:glycosidase
MLPGTVSVYAGDEAGLEGGKDPDNRRCFPWSNLTELQNKEPWLLLTKLIQARKRYHALTEGSFFARPEGEGMVVMRESAGETVSLYLGYPGAVGMPPANQYRTEIVSRGVVTVPGSAGRLVQSGGFCMEVSR